MFELHEMKIEMTFDEEVLGLWPSDPDIYKEFFAAKAPDAKTRKEEIEEFGAEAVAERGRTIFPKLEDGTPFMYDYQIKGMFKDACSMLRRIGGTESSRLTAYKKVIDGNIFVKERRNPFHRGGVPIEERELGDCQRPLRAQTPQGERVSLASSETVPAGSQLTFTVELMDPGHADLVREWMDYGSKRGFGQWRNSGKGRYHWREI